LTLSVPPDYHEAMARKASQRLGLGSGQWLELALVVPAAAAERLGQMLVALGSPGVVEELAPPSRPGQAAPGASLTKLVAAFPVEQATEQLLGAVRQALEACGPEVRAQATLAMQLVDGGAWVEQWKRFYRPFKVGQRLVIRPPWEAYTPTAEEIVLILNPGQAFGTGLHATTQLCVKALEALSAARQGARLLDVGCGSGILSLAAVLFGFGSAFGVDVDRQAVWLARANARLNQLSERVAFAAGSLEVVRDRFEVVVVNILLEPILAMLKPLHRVVAPGGTVILSGILTAELPQLRRGLTRHGWRLVQQLAQQEWAAVICEPG
jgi:ribosomal protein L11 methyltransferase